MPFTHGPLPTLTDAQTIAEVIAEIQEHGTVQKTDAAMLQASGSFGGTKPKALVTIEQKPWLLKFNTVGSPVDTSLIEHATMTLGIKASLRMAKTQVAHCGMAVHWLWNALTVLVCIVCIPYPPAPF